MIDVQPSPQWEETERLDAIADLARRMEAELGGKRWPNLFKCFYWAGQIANIATRRRAWLEKNRESVLDCLNEL